MDAENEEHKLVWAATRDRATGFALLTLALAGWVWFSYLLTTSYTVGPKHRAVDCESVLSRGWLGDGNPACAEVRDPSELIAILALATAVTVAACYYLLSATLTFRSRELRDLGKQIDKNRESRTAKAQARVAARRAAAQPDAGTRDPGRETGTSDDTGAPTP